MKNITILCGLPRSGKSTWVKENQKDEVVISADQMRYLVYNQRYWQEGESLMWSIRGLFLEYVLRQGLDIIIDEANIKSKTRLSLIKKAKKYGYLVRCIYFNTSPRICFQRAKDTNQIDLLPVIKQMSLDFEFPFGEDESKEYDTYYTIYS